jgi:hypothetical protein
MTVIVADTGSGLAPATEARRRRGRPPSPHPLRKCVFCTCRQDDAAADWWRCGHDPRVGGPLHRKDGRYANRGLYHPRPCPWGEGKRQGTTDWHR